MSCEHLICGRCAGPVVEGRCPACRVARADVHQPYFGLASQVVVALLVALFALTAVLAVRATG
ncbi:MAG: hypothetical protein GEV03_07115 [Streptosporangiales bacterium]|nr:hypothetical protein [Streptosporangiales bacterium]